MGVNIYVYNSEGKECSQWDWIRYAGDRDFMAMFCDLPSVRKDTLPFPDIEPYYRPSDFAVWRDAIASREWPNPGRFEYLVDLLETNPDLWVYFSY
jgi:hypothetical protein